MPLLLNYYRTVAKIQITEQKGHQTMKIDFFNTNYPQLSNIYYDYTTIDEYQKHPIVEYVEPFTSNAINEAVELLKQGKELKAIDTLTECAVTYEQSGFILGFSLAMQFIKESTAHMQNT